MHVNHCVCQSFKPPMQLGVSLLDESYFTIFYSPFNADYFFVFHYNAFGIGANTTYQDSIQDNIYKAKNYLVCCRSFNVAVINMLNVIFKIQLPINMLDVVFKIQLPTCLLHCN